jgi:hypothetical protein
MTLPHPSETVPSTRHLGGWEGPIAGLDALEK